MNSLTSHRFFYLLISLLLAIIVAPLLNEFPFLRIVYDISISMIFIFGFFALSRYKLTPWIAIALAIPMLLSIWINIFGLNMPQLEIIGKISGIAYFALLAGMILSFIFTSQKVTWEVIAAALVVYLLLGVLWSYSYAVIDLLQPESFKWAGEHNDLSFLYYSFITLTTVGYGDITPVTGIARSLSMLEGIIGQSYMAVLVARLVGMHVAHSMKN